MIPNLSGSVEVGDPAIVTYRIHDHTAGQSMCGSILGLHIAIKPIHSERLVTRSGYHIDHWSGGCVEFVNFDGMDSVYSTWNFRY